MWLGFHVFCAGSFACLYGVQSRTTPQVRKKALDFQCFWLLLTYIARVTRPERMQVVHTFFRIVWPLTTMRMR